MPAGFADLEAQLWLWLLMMVRPGAAFLAAPIFSAAAVPVQLRLVIALAVGMAALGVTPVTMPADGLTSVVGLMLVGGEVLVGLALGFAVQIGFAAAMLAGEAIGNTMGLGFAGMIDPASGASSPALGQFLSVLGTFLFLAIGGHLMLASIIVDSYRAMPPGGAMLSRDALNGLVMFGGNLFAMGLTIALPVGFSLVLVQLVMAVLARSAPALNLFAVGLPAALMAGIVLLAISVPYMADGIVSALEAGLSLSRRLAGG